MFGLPRLLDLSARRSIRGKITNKEGKMQEGIFIIHVIDKFPYVYLEDIAVTLMMDPPGRREYKRKRNTELQRRLRSNRTHAEATECREKDAARQRKMRENLSPEGLRALRSRRAKSEKNRVAALSPDSLILHRQIHKDTEKLRKRALPPEKKAASRDKKTKMQREKRAAMSEEEKRKHREKDAKRKRDKREEKKQSRKKLHAYLNDKSNPMPLWLLCDIFMDDHNVDYDKINPFPKYHAFMVDFRGKPLHLYLPKYKPQPW